MSTGWITTETLYPFGGAIAVSPESIISTDVQIQKAFPAVEYLGSEASSVYVESREVSGDLWMVTNATFQPASPAVDDQWTQVNPAFGSYAWVFRASGEIDRLSVAAGAAAPLAWTTVFSLVNGALTVGSVPTSLLTGTLPAGNLVGGPINLPTGVSASFFIVNSGTPPSGPEILAGVGAPGILTPNGSIYLRIDGATGSRLYVSTGGTYNAVAGV